MDKLKELLSLCKNSVTVSVNQHRDYYESVEDHLKNLYSLGNEDYKEEIDEDVLNEMIRTNTIVSVQAYPRTAIGFYRVHHYDLQTAIELVLKEVKE